MSQASAISRNPAPNDLEAFWMPFTANRAFKKAPRMVVGAKDMHYVASDGRRLIDGCAGLWCVNAGHSRDPIVAAIQKQAAELDFSPPFQYGNPQAFQLASRVAALAPGDLDHVFFANSGSEAVDTALKIALAYHNVTRQWRAPAAHRPRARLSRRRLRRHLGGRHGGEPQDLRAGPAGRRSPAHDLQQGRARLLARRAGMGRAPGRRTREHRRAA